MYLLCPHCHNAIEDATLAVGQDVACPACGSTFRLEGGSTTGLASRTLGKFELVEAVGHGAFGTVYKAKDPELDRTVAVKVPRAGSLAGPKDLDRFLREARSAAQLRHPSIVSVHEVGTADGVPYLVSDFVEGVTLADWLSAKRPTFRQAAELVATIAEALHYAHSMGVVHRDVKPSNVMIGPDGSPRVMDFGLAKRDAGEVTMTVEGQVLGTPAYMSPEQARGDAHTVDGRSDVYSLGVILYQMLTAELPFRGTMRMLLHQVLHDEPRPPRALNDRIPRDLETVCLKAMAKEPGRRYQTAGELADDLRRYLSGEAVRARPVGALERGWRWARRHPAVAGLSAAVVALLVTGTTVAWYLAVEAIREKGRADTKAAEAIETGKRADASAAESYARLYAARMNLAQAAHERGEVARALELLLHYDSPPSDRADPRGWEWYYLKRACDPQLLTLRGHRTAVTTVALSPDGKRAASGDWYGTVKVWDATTGKEERSFKAISSTVDRLAFSPDGTRLMLVHARNTSHVEVGVWDAAAGRLLQERRLGFDSYSAEGSRVPLALTPDLTRLAVAGSKRLPSGGYEAAVAVWDLTTGKVISAIKPTSRSISSISLSPDGERLATISEETAQIWDVESGEELSALWEPGQLGTPSLLQHAAGAISPDGNTLATNYGPNDPMQANQILWLWDARTGQGRPGLNGDKGVGSFGRITFSPCGRQLAVYGGATVRVWGLDSDSDPKAVVPRFSGGRLRTIRSPRWRVWDTAFSGDCELLALACFEEWTVRIFDAFGGDAVRDLAWGWYSGFAPSRDGKLLAVAGGGRVHGDEVGEARVLDAVTLKELHKFTSRIGEFTSVALSPDNRLLAVGGEQAAVKVWDLATGQEVHTLRHANVVCRVAFSPDGRHIASAAFSGSVYEYRQNSGSGKSAEVKLWDAVTGKELRTFRGHEGNIFGLGYSPDGAVLATSASDHTIRLWDPATGTELRRISTPERTVLALDFSPDGRTLAGAVAVGQIDAVKRGEVILWDPDNGRELRTFQGHTKWARGVCFSPDGRRLVSIGEDDMVKVWDPAGGEELLSIKGGGSSVTFTPDGLRLMTGTYHGAAVWDGRPLPTEFEVERQAHALVNKLLEASLRKADLFERARTDPATSAEARRRAVALLEVEWDDIARDRADRVYSALFLTPRPHAEAVAALRADDTLDDDVRRHAMTFLQERRTLAAAALCEASRRIALRSNATTEDYARALRWAETLRSEDPNNGSLLNTLGVAQYRVGRFREAIDTFTRSERLNANGEGTPLPADLAFLAMAHGKNGDGEKARAAMARLREAMKKPRWAQDPEAQAFLREAEAVVEGPVPK